MVPDSPGFWWYEGADGRASIAEVVQAVKTGKLFCFQIGNDIEEDLGNPDFRWLGRVADFSPPAGEGPSGRGNGPTA